MNENAVTDERAGIAVLTAALDDESDELLAGVLRDLPPATLRRTIGWLARSLRNQWEVAQPSVGAFVRGPRARVRSQRGSEKRTVSSSRRLAAPPTDADKAAAARELAARRAGRERPEPRGGLSPLEPPRRVPVEDLLKQAESAGVVVTRAASDDRHIVIYAARQAREVFRLVEALHEREGEVVEALRARAKKAGQ